MVSGPLPKSAQPVDAIYLIALWIETVFYGINIVVFGCVVYVLAFHHRRRGSPAYKYLLAVGIFLFCLCTTHVAITLRQLLDGFIRSSSIPNGASLYFLDPMKPITFAKQVLYGISVVTQDLIVIWRVYVVWNSWKLATCFLIVEAAHTAASFYVITEYFLGAPLESTIVQRWSVVGWSLDLVVNALGTLAIAGRLWWVGQQTARYKPSGLNTYLGLVVIIMESGMMFSASTVILVVMFVIPSTTIGSTAGVNVMMQLATLSPMLIIAQVWFNVQTSSPSREVSFRKSLDYNDYDYEHRTDPSSGPTFSKSDRSSSPVNAVESKTSQSYFPEDDGRRTYEMHDVDLHSRPKEFLANADAASV